MNLNKFNTLSIAVLQTINVIITLFIKEFISVAVILIKESL